jgi:hypothetical protein
MLRSFPVVTYILLLLLNKKTQWPESTSELYPPSDCRLSAKLVPAFCGYRCHVVSVTDPYGCILGFLNKNY